MLPERKPIRLARSRYLGRGIYFLTICCDGRRPILRNPLLASSIVWTLRTVSELNGFGVHAYCVMADHVHVIVEGLRDESDMERFVKAFKQTTGWISV